MTEATSEKTNNSARLFLVTLGETSLLPHGSAAGPGLLPQGKALSLLTYLHCLPRRTASRDHLIDQFWSNMPEPAARQSLRQVIYRIRTALGGEILSAPGDSLTLDIALNADRDRFLTAVQAGQFLEAVDSYAGPFYPGFAAPGAVGFEQWVDLERAHLQATFLRTLEATVGQSLGRGDPATALRVATKACELVPGAQLSWRLLLEAQVVGGSRPELLETMERFEGRLRVDGDHPEAESVALLSRLRSQRTTAPHVVTGRPQPEMVGREPAFAALLGRWRACHTGRGQIVLVKGAAGIGKTRLLHDLEQRIASLGGGVLTIRARPADRGIPFALAAGLAEAAAGLPGAMGVSPSTAAVLVELAPSISNRFRATESRPRDPEELPRLRTLALTELLQSTTENAPLMLLVDDLHWADDASRQVLASLAERLDELPVLLVVSCRPARPEWRAPAHAELIELQPLSAEQCEAMVASIAGGDPALCAALGQLLHDVSGGAPLLALGAVDVALERGLLTLRDHQWAAQDLSSLREALSGQDVLEQLLDRLPPGGLPVLVALALAGRPLEEAALAAAAGRADAGTLITALELRGLLQRMGEEWEVAHDRLADAALAGTDAITQAAIAGRVGRALFEREGASPAVLRLAGRLLLQAGDRDGTASFKRWLAAAGRRRHWRDPVAAAQQFLGEDANPGDTRMLADSIPRVARLVRGWPGPAALVAFLFLLVTVGSIGSPMLTWLEPPATTIRVSEPPSSRGFLFDADARGEGNLASARNPVPILVTFLDKAGEPTRRAPRMAEVRLIGQDSLRLEGTLSRPVEWGRAEFDDLVVGGGGAFQLEVHAAGLPPVQTGRIFAGADGGGAHPSLRILSGEVNGQRVDSSSRVIRVRAGAEIEGRLSFEAVTTARTAAILMGAVALWGDRTTNFMPMEALPPHGVSAFTTEIRDAHSRRRFRAPTTPGRYQILFLSDTETEMRYIASWTNWIVGQPAWFDGNDLHDLTAEQLALIASGGRVLRPKLFVMPGDSGGTRIMDHMVAGAVLEVIVER
ncbi:MAG: AAA family ATPase [Gemmatimonadales bacterium]